MKDYAYGRDSGRVIYRQPAQYRVPLKWLIGLVLFTALVAGGSWYAYAAPRAENASECAGAADMALVSRALAAEHLDPSNAEEILRRIYVNDTEVQVAMLLAVLRAAYRTELVAKDFSTLLYQTCMRKQGDMDSILGADGT